MKKLLIVLILGFCHFNINAQLRGADGSRGMFQSDSTSFKNEVKIKLDGKTKYTDYKVFTISNDTTYIDTTLSLKKDVKFNYLRKDDFELLPFHNMGQTYSKLGHSFENSSIFPLIGMNAKQYNYYKIEDVKYYYVPTPTSEIMYRTGFEQGQILDALVTMNTSKKFNISLSYKGLRSLGKYRYSLASTGNFTTTFNYHNTNRTYEIKGHFTSFDFFNNENGGLTEDSINYFETNDPNYTDRGRLDVNLTDADNMFEGKRYFTEQTFSIYSKQNVIERKKKKQIEADKIKAKISDSLAVKKQVDSISKDSIISKKIVKRNPALGSAKKVKDSIINPVIIKNDTIAPKKDSTLTITKVSKKLLDFKLGHRFMYETKHYRFNESSDNEIFGDAFNSTIADHTSYQHMNNELFLQLNSPITGVLRVKGGFLNYNYHFNSILYYDSETIFDKLKGNALTVGADWKVNYGKVKLDADAQSILSGDITGHSLKAAASFVLDSIFSFKGFAEINSKSPDFNKLLYQSAYKNYNWQNNFKNEELKSIGAQMIVNKWGNIKATYSIIDNYTYFGEDSKPVQATETLKYFKVKAQQYFTFRNFTIDNTVQYQKVESGDSFFRVPELVTRNTLYYSNYLFKKKPLYLQTGVTFKYFTSFKANAYNPLLSEFVLQNDAEIGNFPVLDFFANAQIRRTRLYLKVENFSASFTGRNYYSAPNYPYRDLTVRFGLVWNFFI
jgi:hypothetical protein